MTLGARDTQEATYHLNLGVSAWQLNNTSDLCQFSCTALSRSASRCVKTDLDRSERIL